jgi:hypothetical protein
MKLEIIGTVQAVTAETGRGPFRSRTVVVAEGGDEGRPLPVEFTATETRDYPLGVHALAAGDLVKISAALYGREWEGRHYLTLRGFAVQKAAFTDPAAELPPRSEAPAPMAAGEEVPF